LKRNEYISNVVTLITGTTLSQIIIIAVTPILSRLYSPADYGTLALYSSIISILGVISCGRYEFAIVVPDNDEESISLLFISLILGIIVGLLILIIIIILKPLIPRWTHSPDLDNWIWLIPANIIVLSIFQALTYWNIRKNNYKLLSKRRVNQSVSTVMIQVCSSVFKLVESGLIIGYLLGQCIASITLLTQTIKILKNHISLINIKNLFKIIKKYRKFPVYDSWPSLLDNLTIAMPVLFFNHFYGSSETGQLSLTLSMLAIPSALIGTSVSQVYYQKLAATKNESLKLSTIIEETLAGLLIISICFCLIVVLLAPQLFPIIFGSSWILAGQFALILAPSISLRFAVSPLSTVFAVLDRLEVVAFWKVTAAIITFSFLAVSIYFNSAIISILFLSINDLLLYSFYLFLIFKVSNSKLSNSVNHSFFILKRGLSLIK